MASVSIRPVRTRRERKRFVKVPFALHRAHPQWVAPLVFERMEFLDRKKNPYFEHAEVELFVAERDGEPVGRISAQVDHRWDEYQGGSDAMFGFFESERGPGGGRRCSTPPPSGRASGPRPHPRADGLHHQRRDRDPDRGLRAAADDPRALAPALLPGTLIEAEGFAKTMDVLMWELQFGGLKRARASTPRSTPPPRRRWRTKGSTIRNMRKSEMAAEVRRFTDVYNEAWGEQLGLRPDHRRRGRVPGQEPEAGDRRELGLHAPKRTARWSARP